MEPETTATEPVTDDQTTEPQTTEENVQTSDESNLETTSEPTSEQTLSDQDYSQVLEDIKTITLNQEQAIRDLFNYIHDFSYILLAIIIGLFASYVWWKESTKW